MDICEIITDPQSIMIVILDISGSDWLFIHAMKAEAAQPTAAVMVKITTYASIIAASPRSVLQKLDDVLDGVSF